MGLRGIWWFFRFRVVLTFSFVFIVLNKDIAVCRIVIIIGTFKRSSLSEEEKRKLVYVKASFFNFNSLSVNVFKFYLYGSFRCSGGFLFDFFNYSLIFKKDRAFKFFIGDGDIFKKLDSELSRV